MVLCSAELRALSSGSGSDSNTDYQSYNAVIDQNFPCPLLSKSMKKNDLILFIIKKSQECLHDTMDLFRVEAYFFWQIMKLFCCQNGKLLMCEVALILLKGYGMIRKNASIFSDAVFYKLWCIPLAKLLFSSAPDDEHREAVIKMGDDFASKGLTYIAHICYVVAKVELGSREQFRLVGCNRFPFGIKVLKEAIMRTETYEYVLSLTSGVAQPNFQIFKLCNTSRLHMITLNDITLEYCEAIARAVLFFPDSFKRTFLRRVIKLSCNLQKDLKQGSEPEWLLELRRLCCDKLAEAKANADEEAEQNLPSTSSDVASEIQEKFDMANSLEFSANWFPGLHLHNDPKNLFTSKYRTGQMLGQGSFGAVFAALCKEDGKQVAIKCVNKKRNDMLLHTTEDTGMLPVEVSLLKKVSQPPCCSNIVNLLEWFDLPDEFIMVLEWPRPCMDLKRFIELQSGRLTESQARDVMLQVIQAVQHCCERGVLHRDIKSTNLLINTETLQVKLIDFGCGDLLKDTPYTNYSGTPTFRPPEWILLKEYNGIPATMWALGILLYNLLTGEFPFISDQDVESGYLIFIPGVSQDCFELMLWCLDLNPDLRPTFEDLLGHEWFTRAV